MITPVPARVDDKKDAVMWSVLNALEQIDEGPSSRSMFAQNILFNLSSSLDGPVFKEEIAQLREILGVKVAPEPEPVVMPIESSNNVSREDAVFREL